MTKHDFIAWAKTQGFEADGYGHFQKVQDGKTYRLKIQAKSVRYEVRTKLAEGENYWVRLRGGYFGKMSLTPDGKLEGLKRAY